MLQKKSDSSQEANETLYNMCKSILLESSELCNFSNKFISELSINIKDEKFSLNITNISGRMFFSGYPSGNYLKSVCKILEIWTSKEYFPVSFSCLPNLDVITYLMIF